MIENQKIYTYNTLSTTHKKYFILNQIRNNISDTGFIKLEQLLVLFTKKTKHFFLFKNDSYLLYLGGLQPFGKSYHLYDFIQILCLQSICYIYFLPVKSLSVRLLTLHLPTKESLYRLVSTHQNYS